MVFYDEMVHVGLAMVQAGFKGSIHLSLIVVTS
jgi:hypothetical protein